MIRVLSAALLLGVVAVASNTGAAAATLAITNAHIFTLAATGEIPSGTILVVDGKIKAVGKDVSIPPDSTVIDAHGDIAMPGFVLLGSYKLTMELPLAPELDDSHTGADLSAGFDIRHGINPDSTYLPEIRRQGATLALATPVPVEEKKPYGYFGGQAALVSAGANVTVGSRTDLIVSPHVAVILQMGASGATAAGGSRSAQIQQLHQLFEQLQGKSEDAKRENAKHAGPELNIRGLSDEDIAALRPVADGKTPLLIQVDSAPDILRALDLANTFKLKVILEGAQEGWRVAGRIAAARAPVIVAPASDAPRSMENWGVTLANAGLLEKAGVEVALELNPGGAMFRFPTARYMAASAVAHGLSYQAALRALTLVPAELFGVGERYGSLEPGKQADIVLWSGDPLEPSSYARTVLIGGVTQPLVSRQTLLRDRYLPKRAIR